MKRLLCGFAAWGLLMGLTGPATAQYTFTTIDMPGAASTYAFGINNAGQIVGSYDDAAGAHGFLLDVDDTSSWGGPTNASRVGVFPARP